MRNSQPLSDPLGQSLLPHTALVLATRPTGFDERLRRWKPWTLTTVEPLGPDKQKDILQRLVPHYRERSVDGSKPPLSDQDLQDWVNRLQHDSRFEQERGNPLWLTLAAQVIAVKDELPTSRAGLLGSVCDLLAEGYHQRDQTQKQRNVRRVPLPCASRPVLCALAYRMSREGVVWAPHNRLVKWLCELADPTKSGVEDSRERWAALCVQLKNQDKVAATLFLDALYANSLLSPPETSKPGWNPASADDVLWSFSHRSLLEVLTAEELLTLWQVEARRPEVRSLAAHAADRVREVIAQRLTAAARRLQPHSDRFLEETVALIDRLSLEEGGSAHIGQFGADRAASDADVLERWARDYDPTGPEVVLVAESEVARFWAEPLGMLAELIGDPSSAEDLFVELARTGAIARTALLRCDRATARSIESILATLGQDEQQERRSVIGEIGRLLGDPDAALDLLKSLGADPRIRADLYFIDEALDNLAKKHAKIAKRAKKTKVKIYTQLVPKDKLPADLFRWVHSDRAIPEDEDLRDLFDEQGRFSLWREIPAGSFDMGEGKEVSQETIEDAFWISAVTVTQEQFRVFDPSYGRDEGNTPKFQGDRLPAIGVSWYAAEAFARWCGYALGLGGPGHLPSEREWEYAARVGSKSRFWFSDDDDDLDGFGWHRGNSDRRVHEVATAPPNGETWQMPNAWGLFDVHGNVWEWCADLWDDNGRWCVVRGGGYWDDPALCRSAYRDRNHPGLRDWYQGFRVVLPAAPVFED